MKLVTVEYDGIEQAAIAEDEQYYLIKTIGEAIDKNWEYTVEAILKADQLKDISEWYQFNGKEQLNTFVYKSASGAKPTALYRAPGKILGIGMNYVAKAMELSGGAPKLNPVFFMKPTSSLIGPNEGIELPSISNHVTAEAELAIVIGETCKNVSYIDASSYVAGFTTTIDMTAQDIRAEDPLYLQRAKSFDTFFSLGSELITGDEFSDISEIEVQTLLNEHVVHKNTISNMLYSPWFIVSFFSKIMTLHPGDVIMTGTPGSVTIRKGDVPGCKVTGFDLLENAVCNVDKKAALV
ncbi:fumarylacetoacetate hydrolase family protein [Paraliobacillus sediminis]|uniref:fumarylacetoacetate hydrolase family protein n=1 Tax=Paraliobacillus sediminis TaxID=1885916 RepID=UPI000E3BD583|nr:fumarylacetoacetate hydrolase family protein [Paraliobacillus sediminis]